MWKKSSQAKYYYKNKKTVNTKNKEYMRTPRGRYAHYKYSAKHRSLQFDLTIEEFMFFWDKECYYCGELFPGIGLDRINNKQGYNIKNVVSCCSVCNKMKLNLEIDDFFKHCQKIIKNKKSNWTGKPARVYPAVNSGSKSSCVV